MFSIDGIASGFNTTAIIESLLVFQQNQIDTFNVRKNEISGRQAAFQGIEARLLTLRGTMSRLNRTSGSVFDIRQTSSSDESIVEAAASNSAATGNYSLTVHKLARAHQIASQGFSSQTSAIATGDYSIRVGDREAVNIAIDSTNNSLQGFVDAINQQHDDVSAGIIFDQSSSEYRILLTSQETGESNQISITANTTNSDPVPDFSGPAVQDAQNAMVTLGSGDGAITAEYATNQIEELIDGVTLDLKSADPSKVVNISIGTDTEPAKEAIKSFVDDVNALLEFIDEQTAFNPETNVSSPLQGNRNVSRIRDQLTNAAIETVAGLAPGFNRLADIGIDIDAKGKLTLDESRLDQVLNGEVEGFDSDSIRKLFGLNGSSTNSGIEFLSGSVNTAATDSPIQVDIIQAAEQASLIATSALSTSTVIDSSNNTLEYTVNGTTHTITLDEDTYTQEQLAAHLQTRINAVTEQEGDDVTVQINGGKLQITTEAYGLSKTLDSFAGTAAATLGFDGKETAAGKDVAGTFIVDGEIEVATGNGRILIGDSENATTADLQVRVTLTPSDVNDGIEADLTVSRGVTAQLDKYLDEILDSETGAIKTINDEFDSRIESIDESIERIIEITESKREYLIREFAALERVISELQTTGNFLSSQLATLQIGQN